jgi:hypothetical protein
MGCSGYRMLNSVVDCASILPRSRENVGRGPGGVSCLFLPLHSVLMYTQGYGWANTYHFLDPETGIALVFGSQLLPPRDTEMLKLWDELEEIFYSGLVYPS